MTFNFHYIFKERKNLQYFMQYFHVYKNYLSFADFFPKGTISGIKKGFLPCAGISAIDVDARCEDVNKVDNDSASSLF